MGKFIGEKVEDKNRIIKKRSDREMCEYCHKDNTEKGLRGDDGVFYDSIKRKHFLYIEHFRNEISRIEVHYCPKCGLKF